MTTDKLPDHPFDVADQFARDIGMPEDTLWRLLKDDDWSLVIKLHALLQGAICHTLAQKLHDSGLIEIFGRLPAGDNRYGLVAFLRHYGLFDPAELKFLKSLAEVRNTFAHNIQWIGRSLAEYKDDLCPSERATFIESMAVGLKESVQVRGKTVQRRQFVRENLKLAMFLSAAHILAMSYLAGQQADLDKREAELAREVYQRTAGIREGQEPEC